MLAAGISWEYKERQTESHSLAPSWEDTVRKLLGQISHTWQMEVEYPRGRGRRQGKRRKVSRERESQRI